MSSDWSQNRAIRDLSEALGAQAAAAASRQRALDRRLQALQGDLSTKVDTLTTQLNALIEIGELRDELTLYLPMRRARDAAEALTRAVLHGDGDLTYLRASPDLSTGGDYWFPPAALAVVDVRDGVIDDAALATALRLDRARTAAYVVAVCTLVGHPELAVALVPDCFVAGAAGAPSAGFGTAGGEAPAGEPEPTPSAPPVAVSRLERLVWRAAGAGLLGGSAVEPVQRAVKERLALAPEADWRREESDPLTAAPRLGLLPGAAPDPLATMGTSSILGAWATWADRIAQHEVRGGRAVGAADLAPGNPADHGTPPLDPAEPLAAVAQIQRGLERVVLSLASEGGPRERELLTRIDLLGTRLGKIADREAQWWSDRDVAVTTAVVRDARGTDADAAALVAPLITPVVRAAVDRHRDELLATPQPTSSARLSMVTVPVTVDDDGTSAAEAARARFHADPLPGHSRTVLGVLGAAALAFAVLAFVTVSWGWAFPAVIAAGIAVAVYVQAERRRRSEQERRAHLLARFEENLTEAQRTVREQHAALTASQESIRSGHGAIVASLDRVGAAA